MTRRFIMRKTVLFLLTLTLMLGAFSLANADEIEIGSGTSTSTYVPIYADWNFSYSQQIYLQSEIDQAGTITKISFWFQQGASINCNNWDIYMGHTTKTGFGSTTDWIPVANLTKVYGGNTFTPSLYQQWITVTLQTPFNYNNSDNLVIAVDENTSGSSNSGNWGVFTPTNANCSIYRGWTTDINPSGPGTATGRLNVKNRIKLDITATGPADPTAFNANAISDSQIDLSWTRNATPDNVLLAWNTTNSFGTPSGSYSAGGTIPGGGTVLLGNSGNTTFNHSGLNAESTYYYKIWSLDGSSNYSSGVTANATTAAGPVIDNPEDFNAGAVSDEQIDLIWDLNDDDDPILLAWNTVNTFGTPSGSYSAGGSISGGGTVLLANSSNTGFNHTGLDADTQYFYKIWSVHEENNVISYSSGVTANASTFDVIIKNFPWMEGFETNSPTRGSWSQIQEFGTQNWVWALGADTGTIKTAHSGVLNARFTSWNPGTRTKLVTPILDLSSLDHPVLSFWYGQEADAAYQNHLSIFYRSNPSAPWTQLGASYTDNISEWTLMDGISLPNPSATYQLAFEALEGAGHANVLDDVEIREDEGHVPVQLSSFTAAISADNFVNLMWVTQSETGVLGFYVLRNTENHLGSALTVSELISATNTSEQQSYIFKDSEIFENGHYYYWLQNSDMDGSVQFHGPVSIQFTAAQGDIPELPLVTQLKPIYPNPFNPMAFIPFSLKESATVNFEIYNTRGQLVKRIPLGQKAAGNHRIEWDGRDDQGINCTTGVYHIRMTAGTESFSRKAVLMK